jgi:hypothetical protein
MGDRTKGRAFLNSCKLYIRLAPTQFTDDHAKIMWAFSFMKSDRVAQFVDQQMRAYQAIGGLPCSSWPEFVSKFVMEFCLKNEVQTARMNLEMVKYFQGSKTVNEYVNEFHEMIDCARYFKGTHIVLKFHQGLNAAIQNHVACMTAGCPSDETLKEWYDAAPLCDENRVANEAFGASSRTAPHPEKASYAGSMFRWLPVRAANMVPPIS